MASTSIGKWLAYVIIVAMLLFVPIAAFLPGFLAAFTSFVTTIIALCTAAVVIYIIIKVKS